MILALIQPLEAEPVLVEGSTSPDGKLALYYEHDAAAHACAENAAEHRGKSLRTAERRLGQGKAIRVVGRHHGEAEVRFEVIAQPRAIEALRVGILERAGVRIDHARRAHADPGRQRQAALRRERLYEPPDLLANMFVALLRFGRYAHAAQRPVQRGGIEYRALDLRAAEVDAPEM